MRKKPIPGQASFGFISSAKPIEAAPQTKKSPRERMTKELSLKEVSFTLAQIEENLLLGKLYQRTTKDGLWNLLRNGKTKQQKRNPNIFSIPTQALNRGMVGECIKLTHLTRFRQCATIQGTEGFEII